MITYAFLQHYWWFLISLLGGLLAFLLFVQGGQSMLFSLPGNDGQKKVMLSVLGRKWEYTFTTLVTFGGALFASFPLFYSTSFGGAYWLWMLILLSFVLQAVSYEFRSRPGNVFGTKTYDIFLFINGLLGTLLVGVVIGTFFTGSDFTVARDNITTVGAPVISRWGNAWHGLESIANLRNLASVRRCSSLHGRSPCCSSSTGPATRSCGHGAGAACGTMPCLSSSSSSCS